MRQNPILNKRRKEEPIVDEAMSWKGKARNKVLPRISLPEGRQNRVSGKNALAVEELQKVEHRHDAGSLGERKDTNRNVGYANPKDQSSTIRTVLMSKEPDKAPDTGQCIVLEGVLQKQHSVAKTKKSSLMIRTLSTSIEIEEVSEDEDKKGNERESFEKEEVPERKNKIAEKVREDADKIKGGAMVNIVETPEESRVLDSIVTSLRQEVPKAERVFKRRGRVKMALKVHENFDPLENRRISYRIREAE